MARIHPNTGAVAFDDLGGSREVAWFDGRRLFQRGADPNWETVAVDANQQAEPLRPFGALGVRGGRLTWHTRLDIGGVPILSSPLRAMDGQVGYEGAVAAEADISVTLDLEKRLARIWEAGAVRSIPLPGGVLHGPWLSQDGAWLIASVTPGPSLALLHIPTGAITRPVCLTAANHYTPAVVTVGGLPWVLYHTDEYGLVIHPATDPTKRLVIAPTPIYGVDACVINGAVEVVWFVGASEVRGEMQRASIPIADLLALPSVPVPVVVPPPPPPVEEAIGPRSAPLPDGTWIDVAAFFEYAPEWWPRGDTARGDSHGMDMQLLPNGDIWLAKDFDDQSKGRQGEVLSIDAAADGFIHLRMDASNIPTVDVWPADSRWLPKRMQIGRQFGFKSGIHQLEKRNRVGCTLARPSQDFEKENWIIAVWPAFYCGADLGECEVMRYAYNNTGWDQGQTGSPALWVETYYMARKLVNGVMRCVGWFMWTSDPSSEVFKTGSAIFPAKSTPTSYFRHLGGRRFPPDVPKCMPPVAIPPPVVVPPPPVVVPPPPPPPVPPIPPTVPPMTDPIATLGNEAIASAIVTAYRTLLKREPDRSGYDAFVSRLANGSLTVAAMEDEIRASDEYKALPVPGVLTLPDLSIVGKEFRDGSALWVARMVSGLTLLVRTPAEQAAFLDWAVQTGFNGVRVFAGALTWAGQTPDGARAALPSLLDMCASRGLVAEVTAITDSGTGYDAKAHLAGVVAILRGRRGVLLENANEVGHPSQSDNITADNLRAWGRELVPPGLLWAVGAANVDEPDAAGMYPTSGGTYSTAHLDRGRPTWNNVRRVREIFAILEATDAPAIDNEPMGADELDGSVTGKQRWNDPALFFTLGALDRAFGTGGVHHSQAGLMAAIPGPVQQACAEGYVAAHAAVESVLPGVRGQYKNVGHAGGPFTSARFVDGGQADGVVRAYGFVDGNRGVVVLIGLKGDPALEWANGWRLIRTVAIRTAQDGRQVAVLEIGR